MKQWICARAEEEYLEALECVQSEERVGSVAWRAFEHANRGHAVLYLRIAEEELLTDHPLSFCVDRQSIVAPVGDPLIDALTKIDMDAMLRQLQPYDPLSWYCTQNVGWHEWFCWVAADPRVQSTPRPVTSQSLPPVRPVIPVEHEVIRHPSLTINVDVLEWPAARRVVMKSSSFIPVLSPVQRKRGRERPGRFILHSTRGKKKKENRPGCNPILHPRGRVYALVHRDILDFERCPHLQRTTTVGDGTAAEAAFKSVDVTLPLERPGATSDGATPLGSCRIAHRSRPLSSSFSPNGRDLGLTAWILDRHRRRRRWQWGGIDVKGSVWEGVVPRGRRRRVHASTSGDAPGSAPSAVLAAGSLVALRVTGCEYRHMGLAWTLPPQNERRQNAPAETQGGPQRLWAFSPSSE